MVGTKPSCEALGLSRSTVYRRRQPPPEPSPEPLQAPQPRRRSHRALSPEERQDVLDELHSERFVDKTPETIVAKLAGEGRYLCSVRTMYRILAEEGELRERRHQRRRPVYAKPELMATAPNQTWSWDVTYLRGPTRGVHYYLYVILDIFSRYIVGWVLARSEDSAIAEHLIRETYAKQNIQPDQLTLHADRGPVPKALSLAKLCEALAVHPSHSRPHTSDDNPFSEANFKTLKYMPTYPSRFLSFEAAHAYCVEFVEWYNNHHCHSGIAFLTPADVHYGRVDTVLEARTQVLAAAYAAHPERFVHGMPTPRRPPAVVYINPPMKTPDAPIHALQGR